jgi:hypothetical protein
MEHATIALIISIIALLLALSKWVYDFLSHSTGQRLLRAQQVSRGYLIRLELLEGQTNCFITRGGYLLFLISFRIYNENDQSPVLIEGSQFQAKIGRKWKEATRYTAPQAVIFPSLFRNNLPLTLEPEDRQDFYEVFALDELIPSTEIKIRLRLRAEDGKIIRCQQTLRHRVDARGVFDMLFRILE